MVETYKLKFTLLQQKILRLLFIKTGISLNALSIARKLNVSQTAIAKSLPFLEENGFIKLKKEKESKRWSIKLNMENHKVIQLKRADNLKLVYESGLADFLEKEFAGATISLFGSYSMGEDNFKSDIDFVVVGRKDKIINLEKFEKIFEKEININIYNSFKDIH